MWEIMKMISILAAFTLGVATSRHISLYDNAINEPPMISKAQERRICAELCMSGLGGEPCGEDCKDIIPQGLPAQSSQSDGGHQDIDSTRRDACPLLCANQLGYPLCGCNYTQVTTPFFKVDFPQICRHYCSSYNYTIFGCGDCQDYESKTPPIVGLGAQVARKAPDWNKWCIQMCREGDGGSACYCDLLPLRLLV